MNAVRSGVEFKAGANGRISTTATGKNIWSAALKDVDDALASAIGSESNWRKNYLQYIPDVTRAALQQPEHAIRIAEQGLACAYEMFVFNRDDQSMPLAQAMTQAKAGRFHSVEINGENRELAADFELDYQGKTLTGQALNTQLDVWVNNHIMEADFAELIKQANRKDQQLDLRGEQYVLFGASSEMGPVKFLLNHGAHVIAVDIGRKHIWQRLIDLTRHSAGKLTIPVSKALGADADEQTIIELAGADLLNDTPEIADWLSSFDGHLNIGSYAYLDAANHVRVVMAMDAITDRLQQLGKTVSLAYLMTPTDVYTIPANALTVCETRYSSWGWRKLLKTLFKGISFGRWFRHNVEHQHHFDGGSRVGIVDSLVPQQGPNYNLAKRLQRWRATIAQQQGVAVSCNVAPSTATHSVTKNKLFSAAISGSEKFGLEVFQPTTASTIMALAMALELRQLQQQPASFENAELLFMSHSCHGGIWSIANQVRSILEPGVVIGFASELLAKKK